MAVLLLATTSEGKIREVKAALAEFPWEIKTLADVEEYQGPVEDGATFGENALIKARAAVETTGWPALADDSGIEVDALDGQPGIYSARFGGPGLTDEDRNRLLLEKMEGVPRERRTARYRAVLVLSHPHYADAFFEGTVEGWIGFAPRGEGGFGYDPIFCLRDQRGALLDHTVAELSQEEKNGISHRGRALQQLRRAILNGEISL